MGDKERTDLFERQADLDKKPRQTTSRCIFFGIHSFRVGGENLFFGVPTKIVEHAPLNNVKKAIEVVYFESPRNMESRLKDMGQVFL